MGTLRWNANSEATPRIASIRTTRFDCSCSSVNSPTGAQMTRCSPAEAKGEQGTRCARSSAARGRQGAAQIGRETSRSAELPIEARTLRQ